MLHPLAALHWPPIARRSILLIPLAVWLPTSAPGAPVRVTVDAGVNVVLGEQTEISGSLFGVTTANGFPGVVDDLDMRARLAAAEPGAISFPLPMGRLGPPEEDLAEDWFTGDEAAVPFEQALLYGHRYPTGRFLRIGRGLGAEPTLCLGGVPEWVETDDLGIPMDFGQYAKLCAGTVALARRFDPELHFVTIWNEPNTHWYNAQGRFADRPGGFVGAYNELFNTAARAIKERNPGVEVGGPTLCWPPSWGGRQEGLEPWYTWEIWALPFLEDTRGNCDFFDFHAYDVTGDQIATQVELIAAATESIVGRRLPVHIGESGADLRGQHTGSPEEWTHRVLPYEDFLWGLLTQTDKVDTNLAFDLGVEAHAIVPDAMAPRPIYWLLWVFRDLRGWRTQAESDSPAVRVAAAVREDRVTVVCHNSIGEPQDVDLQVSMPGGWCTGPDVRALIPAGEGVEMKRGAIPIEDRREDGRSVCSFTLPARATVSIVLRAERFVGPRRVLRLHEFFAGPLKVPINEPGAEAVFHVDVPDGAEHLRLPLGLLGPRLGLNVRISANGIEVVLKDPRAWQEFAFRGLQSGGNTITVAAEGRVPDNLVVAFVSVVSEIEEPVE